MPQLSDFDYFTPRITGEYRLTDNSLAYVSAAKGVKAGGFNGFVAGPVTLVPEEQTFSEEENWTYEFGTKNTLMDGRLVVNAALYFVDWKQSRSLPSPGTSTPPT